jgi:hypothetical protein
MTKEEKKIYNKLYREKNKEKININRKNNKAYFQNYYQKNKETILKSTQEYYKVNKETILPKNREYSKNHYKLNSEIYKEYNTKKYKSDMQTKLSLTLRCRLNNSLKHGIKTKSALNLLGCSIDLLKQHLEFQFKSEMTWENHGKVWEIDHIVPCASFNLIDIEQQKQCFYHLNLQPLFKTTEIAKSFGYINEIGNRNKSSNVNI